MRENYWAEKAPADTAPGDAWYGKYRVEGGNLIKAINDQDGLVLFTSERAARDEAFRAYLKSCNSPAR